MVSPFSRLAWPSAFSSRLATACKPSGATCVYRSTIESVFHPPSLRRSCVGVVLIPGAPRTLLNLRAERQPVQGFLVDLLKP